MTHNEQQAACIYMTSSVARDCGCGLLQYMQLQLIAPTDCHTNGAACWTGMMSWLSALRQHVYCAAIRTAMVHSNSAFAQQ